jgi:RNA polymerase sigma-70 factor (ECF subfamily)
MNGSSEAQDMTQTTLLKIHIGRNSYDSKFSLKTWVFTIAHRALIDHWRVGSKDKENLIEAPIDEEAHQLDGLNLEKLFEINDELQKALVKLKPLDRSIVYLYGVEGLSMNEIANIHATTEGSIKVRAHRAFHELRSLLAVLVIFLKVVK